MVILPPPFAVPVTRRVPPLAAPPTVSERAVAGYVRRMGLQIMRRKLDAWRRKRQCTVRPPRRAA